MSTSSPISPRSKTEPLLRRARKGDQDAWTALLQRYEMMLLVTLELRMPGFLRRYPGAEDVLQEAYLKAWKKIDTFAYEGQGSFRRWLRQIVVNEYRDTLRQCQEEEKRVLSDTDAQQKVQNHPTHARTPSEIISKIEEQAHVLERMRILPEEDQDLIIMKLFEEKTFEEIGVLTDCSRDVASKRFAEVIKRLGRLMS